MGGGTKIPFAVKKPEIASRHPLLTNLYLFLFYNVGSMKKTGIPVLAARTSPAKTATPGRSTSAIDLQAANRAKQHHFSTLR